MRHAVFIWALLCAAPVAAAVTGDEVIQELKDGLKDWDDAVEQRGALKELEANPDVWFDELIKIEQLEMKAHMSLYVALVHTAELYGIAPAGLAFGDTKTATQGPMNGKDIRWSPRVLTRTDQDYIVEYKGADELPHYSGVTQKDLQTDTLANGEVVIPLQVLRRAAAGKGTLRELAYALDHEGVHVADKVTLTEAGTRKDAEVRAYEHGMKRAKDYGYPDDSIPRWHRDQWQIRVDSEATRPVYPGPVDELKMQKIYESQQAQLKSIREHQEGLKRTVEGNFLVKTSRTRPATGMS